MSGMEITEIGVSSRRMYIRNVADIFQMYMCNAGIMPGYITQYCRYTGVRCNVFNIETYISNWRYQKMEKIHLPIIIEMDEDGYYIVSCPLFRGCHSYGETIDEALENIEEVIEMCLEETKIEELNKFVGFRELEVAQNA